jgi:hypothetical protein
MSKTYLSAAETAKLVRAALKRSFPGVVFSVKSKTYSGGASIDVRWIDGPTSKMVEGVAGQFAGGRFDGMVDMQINVSHWMMPDGSVTIASNPGTHDQIGTIPAERNWMPHPQAKLVSFGADFVFCTRDLSPEFERKVLARLASKGFPVGDAQSFREADRVKAYPGQAYDHNTLCDLARQEAAKFMTMRAATA